MLEARGILVLGGCVDVTDGCFAGNRAVVQVFEGTSGIDVKKVLQTSEREGKCSLKIS